MKWNHIATAPKHTMVLVAFADGRIRIGELTRYTDSSYPVVWQDSDGRALARPWKDEPEPTHWMDLPGLPDNGRESQ